MKTSMFRWCLSSGRKAELEAEAQREGVSLATLLDRITTDWLAKRRRLYSVDEVEQAAIRERAMAAIGTVRGNDPTRAERAGALVREIIHKKHVKESKAFGRRVVV